MQTEFIDQKFAGVNSSCLQMITLVLQRLEALTNVNSDFSKLKNKQTWNF
tara:strand:- start:93 stop:242 length:150 start_codon:yes stop_codon:yes gene_type:complete